MRFIVAFRFFFVSSHSHTVMKVQARVSSIWALFKSRSMLRATFAYQNSTLVFGTTYLEAAFVSVLETAVDKDDCPVLRQHEVRGSGQSAPLLETMTIRKYCSYYRIANEAYETYYRNRGVGECLYVDPQDVPEELRDVVYYKRKKSVDVTEMYEIDSTKDFMRFATDHYGELGLSRMNIFASHDRQQGWKIVLSNSYSANAGLAIEVATALYKAGAPLLIYDAEKLLRILLEDDYVRLVPDSYHNYMGYQEEGSVYELPWEYECSDDSNSVLTKEQYQAIVSLAEWLDIERIFL